MALNLLGEDLQEQLLGDQQAAARLTPIYAFLMYDQAQMFDPPDESAHREAVGELGESAQWLYRWCPERETMT